VSERAGLRELSRGYRDGAQRLPAGTVV
jgi:hypothetical protein